MATRVLTLTAVVVFVAAAAAAASAQEYRATLSGTIKDSSGGALPGVIVSIVETRTGVRTQVVTDISGQYVAPFLAPGDYEVLLVGQSDNGSLALADPNGNALGEDADHATGQNFAFPFQVVGIEGRTGAGATAQGRRREAL